MDVHRERGQSGSFSKEVVQVLACEGQEGIRDMGNGDRRKKKMSKVLLHARHFIYNKRKGYIYTAFPLGFPFLLLFTIFSYKLES